MGIGHTHLVAKVCFIMFCVQLASSQMIFHRKLFGDGSANLTKPSKRLCMMKRTTYRLMEQQRQQEGREGGGQGDEVCTGQDSILSQLDLLLGHNT